MEINLKNKITIVTGASGKLGSEISLKLANCGSDIAIHYNKNKNKAISLRNEILNIGRRAEIFKADLTKKKDVEKLKKQVNKYLGFPSILVNNAVIQTKWESVIEQSHENFLQQFESNLLQNLFMIQVFYPDMIMNNYGRIISVNTECVFQNLRKSSAYVSGKMAMNSMLKVLVNEIENNNITVNQVAPGWIKFVGENVDNQIENEYVKKNPMRRRPVPDDVTNIIAFLASDLSSYLNGLLIPVNGGNTL